MNGGKIKLLKLDKSFNFGILLSILSTLIGLSVPIVIKQFIDVNKNLKGDFNIHIGLLIILLLISNILITTVSNFLISKSGDKRIMNIRIKLQQKLLNLPMKYFNNKVSGELSSRVINDANIIRGYVTGSIPSFISSIITVIGTVIILFSMDLKLSLLTITCFPIVAFIAIPIGNINERLAVKTQDNISNLNGLSSESIRNMRILKLNNAESSVMKSFKEITKKLYYISLKFDFIYSLTSPLKSIFSFAIVIFLLLYGISRVNEGTLSIGTLISFVIYFFQVTGPANSVVDFYSSFKQARGSTRKINSILNEKLESNYIQKNPDKLSNKNEDLYCKNVNFSYGKNNVLKDISLIFPSGKKTAIVGPSGAGKTTIINMLTRLYKINKGVIGIGSVLSSDVNLKQWRNLFGVVTQENTIISGSIYDNLTLGIDIKPNKEEIYDALKRAFLFNEVIKMQNGLNTIVGEQGIHLSGGQRQRLQIARAYLRNPKILILDEATSNLDAYSEKRVSDSLNEISKNKTVITIAHRLSTIVNYDYIYFISDGNILGHGNHKDLIKQVPEYKYFVEKQFISKK